MQSILNSSGQPSCHTATTKPIEVVDSGDKGRDMVNLRYQRNFSLATARSTQEKRIASKRIIRKPRRNGSLNSSLIKYMLIVFSMVPPGMTAALATQPNAPHFVCEKDIVAEVGKMAVFIISGIPRCNVEWVLNRNATHKLIDQTLMANCASASQKYSIADDIRNETCTGFQINPVGFADAGLYCFFSGEEYRNPMCFHLAVFSLECSAGPFQLTYSGMKSPSICSGNATKPETCTCTNVQQIPLVNRCYINDCVFAFNVASQLENVANFFEFHLPLPLQCSAVSDPENLKRFPVGLFCTSLVVTVFTVVFVAFHKLPYSRSESDEPTEWHAE